jgi:hypothetical protein
MVEGRTLADQATQRLIAICLPRTELRGNWLPTLYPPVAASGKSCRSCGHALPSVPDPKPTLDLLVEHESAASLDSRHDCM